MSNSEEALLGPVAEPKPWYARLAIDKKWILGAGILVFCVGIASVVAFALSVKGFGPASETMARDYAQFVQNSGPGFMLPLDTILVGSSRTMSSSSFITDSAAGATAFSCVLKTYNGAIGVDPHGAPCGTILEAAKEVGYATGLVATSRITHATPASFAAHVASRDMEDVIAQYELGNYTLGRKVDLMFGGGRCFFRPNSHNQSCRHDANDMFAWAVNNGWTVGLERSSFDALSKNAKLPLLNLFSEDHMAYEIDRDASVEPSLSQMAAKALDILSFATRNSAQGFFLMIEGSRIDMAGHSNDPAPHVHDILAYQETIALVKKFVDDNPSTVMISVSDHETGGMSAGHQLGAAYPDYKWEPAVLQGVKHSGEYIYRAIQSQPKASRVKFVQDTVIKSWLNITDATQQDVDFLVNTNVTTLVESYVGHMVSDRAGLGWSTHGHSAVDVNLYAYGFGSHDLAGNHENTDIGAFIVRHLGLELGPITERLRRTYSPSMGLENHEVLVRQPRHFHNPQ